MERSAIASLLGQANLVGPSRAYGQARGAAVEEAAPLPRQTQASFLGAVRRAPMSSTPQPSQAGMWCVTGVLSFFLSFFLRGEKG